MQNGLTPLHVAAHYDHQEVALLLLEKGASPHATAKVRVWGGGCHRRWGGPWGRQLARVPGAEHPVPWWLARQREAGARAQRGPAPLSAGPRRRGQHSCLGQGPGATLTSKHESRPVNSGERPLELGSRGEAEGAGRGLGWGGGAVWGCRAPGRRGAARPAPPAFSRTEPEGGRCRGARAWAS